MLRHHPHGIKQHLHDTKLVFRGYSLWRERKCSPRPRLVETLDVLNETNNSINKATYDQQVIRE